MSSADFPPGEFPLLNFPFIFPPPATLHFYYFNFIIILILYFIFAYCSFSFFLLMSFCVGAFTGGQEVKIGEFNGVTESLDLSRVHAIRWLGKYPPKDRTLQIFEHNQVNLTVYILLASTASLGIIMTIVFLTINIMFRNQR